jgi:molybdate transport system substrate-binding protein
MLAEQGSMAQVAEIKVVSSPPLRAVLQELGPQFERATGHKLTITTNAVADLKRRIDAGEAFDVAILTPDLIEALIDDGKIAADARANVARSGLGVVVPSGGRTLDVGSADTFKGALLNATSVIYASGSAVMTHIERMFDRLGIAEDIKSKSKLLPAGGHVGKAIAAGAAELGLTHISVILESSGVDLAGPFPADLQFYVTLCGGISAGSTEPEAARALIRYLTGPEATAVIEAKGLERCSDRAHR